MKPLNSGLAGKAGSDVALGVCGCGLAVASAAFGIYMTIQGPSHPVDKTGEFSVFAQLAPREREGRPPHVPSKANADLDMEATASIARGRAPSTADGGTDQIVPGIVLRAVGADAADIAIDGQMRKVRVGDTIPGAGELLAIYPGRRPVLRTSRGLIISAAR